MTFYLSDLLQDPDLVLLTCQSLLNTVLSSWEKEPFMNVEVVLRVYYMLGEVITDKVQFLCASFIVFLHCMHFRVHFNDVYPLRLIEYSLFSP